MHVGCTLHAGTGLRAERCGSNTKSTLSPLLHPPPNSILTQGRRQLKIDPRLKTKFSPYRTSLPLDAFILVCIWKFSILSIEAVLVGYFLLGWSCLLFQTKGNFWNCVIENIIIQIEFVFNLFINSGHQIFVECTLNVLYAQHQTRLCITLPFRNS